MGARHGTRTKYNTGCRCEDCSLAEANYQKGRRHGVDQGNCHAYRGDDLNGRPARLEPGPAEAAILKTVEGLKAADLRPDLVQGALAMARILEGG